MDRSKAKSLGEEAIKVLTDHFGSKGIKVTPGSGKFDNSSFTTHFTFIEPSESGNFVTKEESDYKSYASMFGLESIPFGSTFSANGSSYKICGLKPRSGKYPVLATCSSNGKTFKFSPESVVRALKV